MDLMAVLIIEMIDSALSMQPGVATVYYAVNPKTTTWEQILPHLQAKLGLAAMPFSEWVEKLSISDHEDVGHNPALKPLGFFESMSSGPNTNALGVEFDTAMSEKASRTLRKIPVVGKTLVDRWLQQLHLL